MELAHPTTLQLLFIRRDWIPQPSVPELTGDALPTVRSTHYTTRRMTDQETRATSDSPSVPNHIAEKAKPLHPTQASYAEFCSYYQDTSDDLASTYLDLLEDLVAELNMDQVKIAMLLNFANGATITLWNVTVEQCKIAKNKSTQEKFVRLAFIRRYPGFYEREQGTLVERAQYLELPVKTGLAQLKAKHTPPSVLGLDVIEAGYKSDYLRYHEIVAPSIQNLNTYVTSWQSGIYLAPYTCLIGLTMVGKTRLLMKMAEEMCVVYICLRPEDSTGEPKRSLLANDLLPPSSPDFKAYYIKIIAAIFLVTAKFFQLTPIISNLKKRYREWNEHQTTPTFHRDVLQELRTSDQITEQNEIAKHLTDAVTTVQQVFPNPKDPGLKTKPTSLPS
ncbi:hypothetical protein VP01_225g10 [Puccinia sorghi]|uniref:Uncharacterized protein n=1 Tax=Puccinia sorghi TaxID=27349 RepID=A0A0L6V917_9BASI|nr:hypothetical protein VP01_225g10 [Puccinia sorghi]